MCQSGHCDRAAHSQLKTRLSTKWPSFGAFWTHVARVSTPWWIASFPNISFESIVTKSAARPRSWPNPRFRPWEQFFGAEIGFFFRVRIKRRNSSFWHSPLNYMGGLLLGQTLKGVYFRWATSYFYHLLRYIGTYYAICDGKYFANIFLYTLAEHLHIMRQNCWTIRVTPS